MKNTLIELPKEVQDEIKRKVWDITSQTPDKDWNVKVMNLSLELKTALAIIYWKDQEIKQLNEVIQRKAGLNK